MTPNDSQDFRKGHRHGSAERMIWIWTVLDRSDDVHDAKQTVETEMRRMFPGLRERIR